MWYPRRMMVKRLPPLPTFRRTALTALAVLMVAVPIRDTPSPDPATRPRAGANRQRAFFADWHHPHGTLLPAEVVERIHREVRAVPEAEIARGAEGEWQSLGPHGIETPAGQQVTGRVLDLEPRADGSLRVASASGGLWRTGPIFSAPLSDSLPSLAIGSFATNPNDADDILVGTGEPHLRAGAGLHRTTDGGGSWQEVPIDNGQGWFAEPSSYYRIRYDPNDPAVIHAATNEGYYRSTNSAASLVRMLGGDATDLAIVPENPTVLYTARHGDAIYRSPDGGDTWVKLDQGGAPISDVGRTALAASPADPDRVYASVARDSDNRLLGIFRTTDAGRTWDDISPGTNHLGEQGWYNNVIAACPTNPDIVLAGGVVLLRSTDGGDNWTNLGVAVVHVDQHAIAWSPDGASVWVGNDGGWIRSTDQGATWSDEFNTLPITQYYHVGVSSDDFSVLGGGTQDNGISLTVDSGALWSRMFPGDGCDFAVDAGNSANLWVTNGLYSGDLPFHRKRSTNTGGSWGTINNGLPPTSYGWPKIVQDGGSPPWLYTNSGGEVYRSKDAGDTWRLLSPGEFPHIVGDLVAPRRTILHGDVLYASLGWPATSAKVQVYRQGIWEERSGGIPSSQRVRRISLRPADPSQAWAVMNGTGESGGMVFRTTDMGVAWTDITGDLPNLPLADLIPHPVDDNILYLASQYGCFRTTDGGSTWLRWNEGMPGAAIVTDLECVNRWSIDGTFHIIAGTYGRGAWGRTITDGGTTAVPLVPTTNRDLTLSRPTPNPASTHATIRFHLPREASVQLTIHDVAGRRVASVLDETRASGDHFVNLPVGTLPPGIFFVRLRAGELVASEQLTLSR